MAKRQLTEEQFLEEMAEEHDAIAEGRATELVRCYLCHLESTGVADDTQDSRFSPFRAVVRRGTTPGPDPYASVKVSCGHTLI